MKKSFLPISLQMNDDDDDDDKNVVFHTLYFTILSYYGIFSRSYHCKNSIRRDEGKKKTMVETMNDDNRYKKNKHKKQTIAQE